MGPGRPRDSAPEGFRTVREAAGMLGISETAVYSRIRRGTLPTREGKDVSGSLEVRHYIPEAAIQQALEEKNLPATKHHTDLSAEFIMEQLQAAVELGSQERKAIHEAIQHQEENVTARLDKIQHNQERVLENLEEAITVLVNAAKLEKEWQVRTMEMMEREAERQEKRSRGFWRRLFGN